MENLPAASTPPAPPTRTATPLTWKSVLPFVLLGLLVWATYFSIGAPLEARKLFQFNDLFFNSDTFRITRDIGVFDAPHKRSNVHPLWIMFVTPIGSALSKAVGSTTIGPLLLTTFFGGACIALAGLFLVRAGLPLRRAMVFALLLACSSGHIFFGSLPETFSASAISIMAPLFVLMRWPGNAVANLAAGLFSFGVLLTNLGMAGLAYFASFFGLPPERRKLKWVIPSLVLYPLVVIELGTALAWWQFRIWPSTRPFYHYGTFNAEARFMPPLRTIGDVLGRELQLARHMFVFDWFAPPLRWVIEGRVGLRTDAVWLSGVWGVLGTAGWLILLAASAFLFVKHRLYRRPLPLGLLLCFLFNVVLHTTYGDDLFLYACNTNSLLLALVALSTAELRLTAWRVWAFDAALLLIAVLEAACNQRFVAGLHSVFTAAQWNYIFR